MVGEIRVPYTASCMMMVGTSTERKTIFGPGGQAKATSPFGMKTFPAPALDFGSRIMAKVPVPDKKPLRTEAKNRLGSQEKQSQFDYVVLQDEIGPQDGESAEQRIRKMRNGNRAKSEFEKSHLGLDAMPPISAEQAVDLMNYYYLARLSRQHPQDEQTAMKLKTYSPGYFDSPLLLDGNSIGDAKKAREFLSAVKKEALRFAEDRLGIQADIDGRLEKVEQGMQEAIGRFCLEESEKLSAISEFYASKDERLARRIENSRKPCSMVEKARAVARKLGLGKIGIGIGTALSGLGTAFKAAKMAIKEIIGHIPLVSQVPPELVGLWLVGAVAGGLLFARGFSKALIWHFEVVRGRLSKREAAKRAEVMDKFAGLKDNARRAHDRMKDMLTEYCESQHKLSEQGFRERFGLLASSHGYMLPS